MRHAQPVVASLDIGGTKVAVSLADASGPLLRLTQATIRSGTPDTIARQGIQLIDACCEQLQIDPSQVSSVGVSSCGPFEVRDGTTGIIPPNLCGGLPNGDDLPNDWTFLPLESLLRERFAEVHIANDCVAALHGERAFGTAPANSIYVTWSTGIGFGLCVDGHILKGKAGNAGHAGHMLLSDSSDALCGCGNRGDLEGMIGGRNFGKHLGRPLEAIFQDAQQGDAAALAAVQEAARWFGRALYNLTAVLDTEAIFVGGSVWRHNEALLAPLVRTEIDARFPALTRGVRLQGATLGELVTDMGAFALAIPQEWIADWRTHRPWEALHAAHLTDAP
ncbi:MAG: ROK family protein [Oxalobacteraceae bacterium]